MWYTMPLGSNNDHKRYHLHKGRIQGHKKDQAKPVAYIAYTRKE